MKTHKSLFAAGAAVILSLATSVAAATYQPGDKVKCLSSEDGGSVTFYATWEDVFVLAFDNNASGAVGSHIAYTNAIGGSFRGLSPRACREGTVPTGGSEIVGKHRNTAT